MAIFWQVQGLIKFVRYVWKHMSICVTGLLIRYSTAEVWLSYLFVWNNLSQTCTFIPSTLFLLSPFLLPWHLFLQRLIYVSQDKDIQPLVEPLTSTWPPISPPLTNWGHQPSSAKASESPRDAAAASVSCPNEVGPTWHCLFCTVNQRRGRAAGFMIRGWRRSGCDGWWDGKKTK